MCTSTYFSAITSRPAISSRPLNPISTFLLCLKIRRRLTKLYDFKFTNYIFSTDYVCMHVVQGGEVTAGIRRGKTCADEHRSEIRGPSTWRRRWRPWYQLTLQQQRYQRCLFTWSGFPGFIKCQLEAWSEISQLQPVSGKPGITPSPGSPLGVEKAGVEGKLGVTGKPWYQVGRKAVGMCPQSFGRNQSAG